MATSAAGRQKLGKRVDELEGRVDDLTDRVDTLEETTGLAVAPEPPEPEAEAPRCPGCHLEVEDPKARRCVWCGFVFSAARPRRGRRGPAE